MFLTKYDLLLISLENTNTDRCRRSSRQTHTEKRQWRCAYGCVTRRTEDSGR